MAKATPTDDTPVIDEPEVVAEPEAPPPVDNDHVDEGATPFTPEDVAANAETVTDDVTATLDEIFHNASDPAVREALSNLAVDTPADLTDQMRALGWATTDPDARIQLLAQADRLDL